MPSPIRERYQLSNGITRLPCDDRKVADTLSCTDYVVHCTDPNHRILFSVQGAGDIYVVDQTCSQFLSEYQNWGNNQKLLETDFTKFSETFKDANGATKSFQMDNVTFRNKFGVTL